MINNTVLPTRVYYYPLGNTPPVCLTQDLPPELDADILLLGCGDARNILFTCFVDRSPRMLDITCCDMEPGIHARNVLLYSLFIDDKANHNIDRIWNIYYHWMLDEDSLELLETQTEKLLQFSTSLDQWHGSLYGSTIRFYDDLSLSRVRGYWLNFLSQGLSSAQNADRLRQLKDALARAITCRKEYLSGDGLELTGLRSTLPGFSGDEAANFTKVSNQWWDQGTVPLCIKPHSKAAAHLNPSFFYTPNPALTLHYGTSPLIGFPLSTTNICLKKTESLYIEQKHASSMERLVRSARSHFTHWASAFRPAVKHLIIRIFSGDALVFCSTLCQGMSEQSNLECFSPDVNASFSNPGVKICSDNVKPMPSKFDCVDTSNLADHLGPLNIITFASILLKYSSFSSLYTETLLKQQHHSTPMDRLTEFMGADVRTMSLLLGLLCPDLSTNATNCVEENPVLMMLQSLQKTICTQPTATQSRSRLRWKRLIGGYGTSNESEYVRVRIEAGPLAKFLVQLYNEMFSHEKPGLFNYLRGNISGLSRMASRDMLPTYNRASFAFILNVLKANVISDWDMCMQFFWDALYSLSPVESLLASTIHDLGLHLHLLGINSDRFLKPEAGGMRDAILAPLLPSTDELPDQLCVTIRVPRKNLGVIISKNITPPIVCSVQGGDPEEKPWVSFFSSIQIAFGNWQKKVDGNFPYPCIVEDSSQLLGTSDMFASFLVPTELLLRSKKSVPLLKCGLMQTTMNLGLFITELGLDLCLASAKMTCQEDVLITQFLPRMFVIPKLSASSLSDTSALVTLHFSDDGSKVKTLVKRINLHNEAAKAKLAMKSSMVTVEFKSPLLAIVTVARSLKLEFRFPVPVSVCSNNYKVRFGRTTSFIEVESSLLDPFEKDNANFLFPMLLPFVSCGAIVPTPWTAVRIDVDNMPQIDLSDTANFSSWLNPHIAMMFSNRERGVRGSKQSDTRTQLKDSLLTIFFHFTGLLPQINVFGLTKEEGGVQTLIFPAYLRLDLVNQSVVLDCAIMPLTHDMFEDGMVNRFLQKLTNTGFFRVKVSEAEYHAWKILMPALVERCRTTATWKHTSNCEYIQAGDIPVPKGLSQEGVLPICSCGIGKFPTQSYLESLKDQFSELSYLLKRYATRAAFAPIFSVPYLEMSFLPDSDLVGCARQKLNKDRESCGSCGRENRENLSAEAQSRLLTCSRCKSIKYCSTNCQKADWCKHKLVCKSH